MTEPGDDLRDHVATIKVWRAPDGFVARSIAPEVEGSGGTIPQALENVARGLREYGIAWLDQELRSAPDSDRLG